MTYEQAKHIRTVARKRYNELRRFNTHHPSFDACDALEYAEALLGASNIGTFGTEGSAWTTTDGITYLNTGDSYDTTVYAITSRHDARFYIGSWGDYVERHPRRFQ